MNKNNEEIFDDIDDASDECSIAEFGLFVLALAAAIFALVANF